MDAAPNWDDAGITAGALVLTSALASFSGLRWWLAAPLAAGPILFSEYAHAGWGILAALAFTTFGSIAGAGLRRMRRG
jgi:hypothetical protein